MKIVEKLVPAFIVLGFSVSAHASQSAYWYAEPPAWMTSQYPDVIECRFSEEARVTVCVPGRVAQHTEALIINTSTQQIRRQMESTIVHAQCGGNGSSFCLSHEGHDIGRVNGWASRHTVLVLRGYYVHTQATDPHQGPIRAYRRGTGPMGHQYPQFAVWDHGAAFTTQQTSGPVYDLWCSPREDLCSYTDSTGREYRLDRDELSKYIPIATDLSDCIDEACYNENMEIIGLNPERYK